MDKEVLHNLRLLHERVLTVERVFDSTLTVLMDKGIVTQEEIQTQIFKDSEAPHA